MSEQMHTVLVVDDEPQIQKLLKITLEAEGYRYEDAASGAQALRLVGSLKPNLILLDLGLPDADGKDVLEGLRAVTQCPVIICSVRDADDEILAAFDKGATDYVTKPFNPDILLARIRANLAQFIRSDVGNTKLTAGPIVIDLERHQVTVQDNLIKLTPKEYKLLEFFMRHQGKMLTHKQILKDVWGAAHGDDVQYLRVYVRQLRDKLETLIDQGDIIMTEPGIGYRLDID